MPKPKEIDFDFIRDDSKIWELDIPIEEIPTKDLEHNLDIAYLEKEGTDDWNLTLRELIDNPEKEPWHYKRVKSVKMEYPIAIYYFRGSWKILDGVHRYCRAVVEGRKTIRVKKVTKEMIPKIIE